MSRAKRKRIRQANGLQRTVAARRIVTASIRAGVCPCETEVDNPGPHIDVCQYFYSTETDDLPW